MDPTWDPMRAFDGYTRNVSHDIWHQMYRFQLPKWGFVIMRCTYGDDEAWSEVLRRLDAMIQNCFDTDDELDVQVLARHDWSVQEDPAALEGASKDAIRRRFKQWADTAGRAEYASREPGDQALIKGCIPRFSYCIAIDKGSMDSILADPMHIFEGTLLLEPETYVNVIRAEDEWYEAGMPDFDMFDWSQYTGDDAETPYDEGEEEIEGSRQHDVGWTMFRLDDLRLELWRLLSATFAEWDALYVRPNEGMAMRD